MLVIFTHFFLDDKYFLFRVCRKLESYKYSTGYTFIKEGWKEKVCNKLHTFEISKEDVRKIRQKLQKTSKPENSVRSSGKRKTTAREDRLITKEVKKHP